MATVVLLRGFNLGKRRFSTKAMEKALADLDAVNVGAAGTFVVRGRVATPRCWRGWRPSCRSTRAPSCSSPPR